MRSLHVLTRGGKKPDGVKIAALVMPAMLLLARPAVAQARGTLQVSATVVDTRVSALSLSELTRMLRSAQQPQRSDTLAVIRIERREDAPRLVVVTIDYSRN